MVSTSVLIVLSSLLVATRSQDPTCPSSKNHFINVFEDTLRKEPVVMSTLVDAPYVQGVDPSAPAYEFAGVGAGFAVTSMSQQIRDASCTYNEVTFTGRVFIRDSQSDGPMMEISYAGGLESGLVVYLLIMDAAANEIVLGYRHQGRLHSETIPVRLISGKWRNYAITLSGNLLTFYFDCDLVTRRVVPLPDYCANDSTVVLHVAGSINGAVEYTGSTGLYAYMQNLGIQFGPGGLTRQCPDISDECPTCGQFFNLLEKMSAARERIEVLQERIEELETNTSLCDPDTVPTPPSRPSTNCIVQDGLQRRVVNDSQFLLIPPNKICYCDNGRDVCANVDDLNVNAPVPDCPTSPTGTELPSDSQTAPTSPMPSCNSPPGLDATVFVGETLVESRGSGVCVAYSCIDEGVLGHTLLQMPATCSELPRGNCAGLGLVDRLIRQCCGDCDPCSLRTCPVNSMCMLDDVSSSESICVCNMGFTKMQENCVDIDECSLGFRPGGHDCNVDSTVCENTDGSFVCLCRPGYTRDSNSTEMDICDDIDECDDGSHNCGQATLCTNQPGSFTCSCLPGYAEDDNGVCQAVCEPGCLNRGVCSSPDTCTCQPGFTGAYCEEDIDECADLKPCEGTNFQCVNTVGGYFCRCERGYRNINNTCADVNECKLRISNCVNGATCVNVNQTINKTYTERGFRCLCPDGNQDLVDCTGHCIRNGRAYKDGESSIDRCLNCTCLGGEMTCRRLQCDCNNLVNGTEKCCSSQCNRRDCSIMNGTVLIRPGATWVNPSNRCERYDCKQDLTAVFVNYAAQCPDLDCPMAMQTTPMGKCCPICMFPTCDLSMEGRALSIRNGCRQCTCHNSAWSCQTREQCPPTACENKDIVFYRNGCCPVCRQEVLGSLKDLCPT